MTKYDIIMCTTGTVKMQSVADSTFGIFEYMEYKKYYEYKVKCYDVNHSMSTNFIIL